MTASASVGGPNTGSGGGEAGRETCGSCSGEALGAAGGQMPSTTDGVDGLTSFPTSRSISMPSCARESSARASASSLCASRELWRAVRDTCELMAFRSSLPTSHIVTVSLHARTRRSASKSANSSSSEDGSAASGLYAMRVVPGNVALTGCIEYVARATRVPHRKITESRESEKRDIGQFVL